MGAQEGDPHDMTNSVNGRVMGPANLNAWRYADDLAVELFKVSRKLPADLRWLSSQIVRSATSAPANISEGYARTSKKEYLQFLSIAKASLAEVEYWLHFLRRVELLDDVAYDRLSELRVNTARTLFGLMRSVRSRLSSSTSAKAVIRVA
jgi:four helix bundle protein